MMIACSLRKLKSFSAALTPLRRQVYPNNIKAEDGGRCIVGLLSTASSSSFSTSTETSGQLFPWRHDSEPPDRVLAHDDFSGAFNPTARDPPILRKLIAARELNIPLCNIVPVPFHKHEWEVNLATNFAIAFEFALEELLSSLFRVPVKNENGTVSIDSSTNGVTTNDTESFESNDYLYGMVEKKLIGTYAKINPENIQLKLSLKPIEAELMHIFAIPVPGLTREIVEDSPYVRGNLYRLHTAYAETGFDEHYFDLLTDFAKHGRDKRTIVAEAAIRCHEFFQVKDKQSGLVVQGMEDGSDEEEVVHIVRFEVVTDKSDEDGGEREIGNWKIIDIDDLLEGNVFH